MISWTVYSTDQAGQMATNLTWVNFSQVLLLPPKFGPWTWSTLDLPDF